MSDDEAEVPEKNGLWGHPPGLPTLFSAEMWERFCYYTMRGLLTLYLIKALAKGDTEAFTIYGAYTALVYAAPVLGGQIADKLLGYRRAVILGGVMMAIGEFLICFGVEDALYLGMGIIIVGNGYFKANISSIVGKLYKEGDPRRDSGFTIFYMGINLGAVGATLIGAPVGEGLSKGAMGNAGYLVGFALAGVGMIAGLAVFIMGQKNLGKHGDAPDLEKLKSPWIAGLSRQTWCIIASFAVVPVLYLLLINPAVVGGVLLLAFLVVLYQLGKAAFVDGDKVQRDRIIVLMILMFFNVVFWALFEQAGSSLTLFADRNVDRMVFGLEMPASMTQFFNPAFIIVFGSVFSILWIWLEEKNLNPNIPSKFGLGIMLLGLGYLMLKVGAGMAGVDANVPLFILAVMYMLHTTGELFLSPIGLSMVTKLAPPKMTGQVMGAWFLSFAGANFLAGLLAVLTGVEGEEQGRLSGMVDAGPELLFPPGRLETIVSNGQQMMEASYFWDSLNKYVDIYTTMGLVACGIGVFLLLLSRPLNRMMHGVR